MGQRSEIVKAKGVKYESISYSKDSMDELNKIYEHIFNKKVQNKNEMREELFEELECVYNIQPNYFGDNVCDSKSMPIGVILEPTTDTSFKKLNDILLAISSKKKIENHTEIYYG
jgi:hypothetical protein